MRLAVVLVTGVATACLSRPFPTRVRLPEIVNKPAQAARSPERPGEGVRSRRALMPSGAGTGSEAGGQDGIINSGPQEQRLQRGGSFDGDLRSLPDAPPARVERPEVEEPFLAPSLAPGTVATAAAAPSAALAAVNEPAPTPNMSFDGLDFANWGSGHPPAPASRRLPSTP